MPRWLPWPDRFWSKVNKHGPIPAHRSELGPCWVWTSATDPNGYGNVRDEDGTYDKSHRVALRMALKRPIRDGFCSLHKCDNPPCVRNDGTAGHVFEGTKKDNTSDMMSKGRNRYKLPTIKLGEHHHQSRLTKDQVVEIKTRRNETKSSLAREFGVSRSTIRNIHDGKVWGWLKVS